MTDDAKTAKTSPYFRLPDLRVCSVRYPVTGDWIMWNWERSTWDHRSDAERDGIKAAEKALFETDMAKA